MPPRRKPSAPWSALEGRLRSIEQGDLIAFGAIGIAVTPGSVIADLAGLVSTDSDDAHDVVSLTIETASGWYAVLSQDCDIVRHPDVEPCLTVAPVIYLPDHHWQKLTLGQSTYRQFPMDRDRVTPLDPEHAARIPEGYAPAVDIRYIGTVDKTALAAGVEQRHVLAGKDKLRFQQWTAARFGRESFADAVHERVLPAARTALDDALQRHFAQGSGSELKVIASVSEWYVRATDRYVEVMGRLDPDLARACGTVKKSDRIVAWNHPLLSSGCKALTAQANVLLRGGGYTLRFTVLDFDELSANEFETYAYWHVQDEPPPQFRTAR